MIANQWRVAIKQAMYQELQGNPQRLAEIAQMLADAETARDALVSAGYGTPDDGLMDVVALVVEEKEAQRVGSNSG